MSLSDLIREDAWYEAAEASIDYRRRVCIKCQTQYEFELGHSSERLCDDCAEVQCHGCDEGTRADGSEYCIDCRREMAIYQECKRLRLVPVLTLVALLWASSAFAQTPLNLTLPVDAVARPVSVAEPSRDSRTQTILRAVIIAVGAGLDAHSTARAAQTPGLEEQNFWIYGKHPTLRRMIVTKIALNAPMLYVVHKLAQRHPSDAVVLSVITAAPQAAAGVINYAMIRDAKKGGR